MATQTPHPSEPGLPAGAVPVILEGRTVGYAHRGSDGGTEIHITDPEAIKQLGQGLIGHSYSIQEPTK